MSTLTNFIHREYPTKAVGPDYHIIGQISSERLNAVMEEIPPLEQWQATKRDKHHILEQGRSLIMRDHLHRNTGLRGKFPNLEAVVNQILGLGFGTVPAKIVAAYLPPGKVIKPHKDSGEYYKYHNRIHVPLVTSEKVVMTVEGKDYYMDIGKIYLFPNLRRHGVRNESNVGRIHLIVDVLDPRYSAGFYKKSWPVLLTNFLWLGSLYRLLKYRSVQRSLLKV